MMSSSNVSRFRRVSVRQLDVLWEFLNSHRDIAVAFNRTLQAKEYSKQKWRELADILNSQGDGAHKDWQTWSKYWVDYKSKLKRRATALRSSQNRTGGGPSGEQPLTDIEKKFLQILGDDVGQGLPGILVEPFVEPAENYAEVPVIIEDIQYLSRPLTPVVASLYRTPTVSPEPALVGIAIPTTPRRSPRGHPPPQSVRSSQPTPAPAAGATAAAAAARRRRRRQEPPPMTQEAARRALVQSSQQKADAATASARALEVIGEGVREAVQALQNIERTINAAFPRAGEQGHFVWPNPAAMPR